MADQELLAGMYHAIMRTFVEEGRAPHYTELARRFGLSPEEARLTLHELLESGIPCWARPGTDFIESFAPFNNLPTHHKITVDSEQRWYAQCGFESLAITWLFPGKEIRVDSVCLDCGDPVRLRMRDGELLEVDPAETVGHANIPLGRWREHIARA